MLKISITNANYNSFKTELDQLQEYVLKDYKNAAEQIEILYNDTSHTMSVGRAVTVLIILRPLIKFNVLSDITLNDAVVLFSADIINNKQIDKQINNNIELMTDANIHINDINHSIAKSIHMLSYVGAYFNKLRGNSMSIYTIYKLSKQIPEFKDLLDIKIPEAQQCIDIENQMDKYRDIGTEMLKRAESTLGDMVRCGSMVNLKQMSQCIFTVGFKPNLTGETIPYLVNTSFLRGLRSTKDLFIIGKAARKASINNFMYTRSSGYLSRKLALLVLDTFLNPDSKSCCSSVNRVPFLIRNNTDLKDLNKRFYTNSNGTTYRQALKANCVRRITPKATSLIGKTVYLFDPITCADDKVCACCYGGLHNINKDYHAALCAALFLGSRIIQNFLSTKHLLHTDTDRITMPKFGNPEIMKLFHVDKNYLVFSGDKLDIHIAEGSLEYSDFSQYPSTDIFTVIPKKGDPIEIKLPEPVEVVVKLDENGYATLTDGVTLFKYTLQNNEIKKSMMSLLSLIEKKSHLDLERIEDVLPMFLDLMKSSNIDMSAVHASMILRPMMRDPDDLGSLPAWAIPGAQYYFATLSESVLNSKLGVSLIFERHKTQFTDSKYLDRPGVSLMDALYRPRADI